MSKKQHTSERCPRPEHVGWGLLGQLCYARATPGALRGVAQSSLTTCTVRLRGVINGANFAMTWDNTCCSLASRRTRTHSEPAICNEVTYDTEVEGSQINEMRIKDTEKNVE